MGLSILPSVLLSYVVLFLLYTPTNGDKKVTKFCLLIYVVIPSSMFCVIMQMRDVSCM
jgi:hypothetical protein